MYHNIQERKGVGTVTFVNFLNPGCRLTFSIGNEKKTLPKGQLNSEWIYEVIVSPKIPTKNYRSLPYLLINFLGRNLCNFWLGFWEKRWTHDSDQTHFNMIYNIKDRLILDGIFTLVQSSNFFVKSVSSTFVSDFAPI